MLALSYTYSGKPALLSEPVTKARTRFRSHPLDPRSQLDADRFSIEGDCDAVLRRDHV